MAVELMIMRHGIAEDREEFAKKKMEDHLRPLTMKGRRKVQKVAGQLKDWYKDLDLIVSSPYTRARQTAELVSQVFVETKVVESAELVPTNHPQAFKRWLRTHGDEHKRILVVGHEPHLSLLASFLMTGQTDPILVLKKGGVLCLKVEDFKNLAPNTAVLQWLLQPKHILTK